MCDNGGVGNDKIKLYQNFAWFDPISARSGLNKTIRIRVSQEDFLLIWLNLIEVHGVLKISCELNETAVKLDSFGCLVRPSLPALGESSKS